MKKLKYAFFTLSFLLFVNCIYAQLSYQEAYNAQKKYWYYHYRLLNDFMLEGDCQGCSIPAIERDVTNNTPKYFYGCLDWGDACKGLGKYIGVLATEYKMLSDNGGNTDSTARELYFALKAINQSNTKVETR